MYASVTEFYEEEGNLGEFIGLAAYTLEDFMATEFKNTEGYHEAMKEISHIKNEPKMNESEKNGWLPSWATCFC